MFLGDLGLAAANAILLANTFIGANASTEPNNSLLAQLNSDASGSLEVTFEYE
jgi:hypothetical protein